MLMSTFSKCIPRLRVLPEDHGSTSSDSASELEAVYLGDSHSKNGCTSVKSIEQAEHDNIAVNSEIRAGIPYELRDESGRPWWKFFDEFEYRVNKHYRTSRKWHQWLYPNHATHTAVERKMLYKIDLLIGLYFLVLCWSKSVDTNNFTNAYVSGMREDLRFKGNDYINTSVISNVGSIVLQLPFIYILPRFPAHIILPIMDLGWTWFTFACYRANSLPELRAYRFILNAFGAAYYPVSQYVLGSWYAPDELTSRVCLFFFGQLLGGVTSGLLQARIFKSLNGVHGLAGWRWMFLIDAIAISLPTCILGFFLIPGIPSKCYSLFLTDEEIRIARQRNARNQIKDSASGKELTKLWDKKLWITVFGTAPLYLLTVFDLCSWNNTTAFNGAYTLWLRANPNYSTVKVNNLSVLPACLGFAYVAICCFGADKLRCKWGSILFAQTMNLVSIAILIKWDVGSSAKWYAFLTSYFSIAATPCLWSYINDFLRFDPQVKALTWILIYCISQSTNAWIPALAWKTTESPRFKTGYIVSIVFTGVYWFWVFVVLYFYKRNEKKHALGNGIILYNSAKGERPPEFIEMKLQQKSDGYYYMKERE